MEAILSLVFCKKINTYISYTIQFNSVYLYSPISQITNLSRSALQSVLQYFQLCS